MIQTEKFHIVDLPPTLVKNTTEHNDRRQNWEKKVWDLPKTGLETAMEHR